MAARTKLLGVSRISRTAGRVTLDNMPNDTQVQERRGEETQKCEEAASRIATDVQLLTISMQLTSRTGTLVRGCRCGASGAVGRQKRAVGPRQRRSLIQEWDLLGAV